MTRIHVQKWIDGHQGEMSEDAIRNKFQESDKYLFSRSTFSSGTKFSGSTRAGYWFILSGSCSITFGSVTIVTSGDFFECPAGDFDLAVVGDSDLDIVKTWLLPKEFQDSASE